MHSFNHQTNNIIFISQALHHLEKSIFLRDEFFLNARVLNFHKNQQKLQSQKNNYREEFISHLSSFDQINFEDLEEIDIFIFYSFSPTVELINFIKKIKQANRKIILIQDNHQFSVHQGSVNSIILRPDLVIAASDEDKNYLIKKLYFSAEDIISIGWLFNHSNNKKERFLKNNLEIKGNKKILIAFAAHPGITLLSDETYHIRKEIICWVQENFSEHQLLIKLHPHESLKDFKRYLSKYYMSCTFLSSQSSISEAIQSSDIILCSNESQIAMDTILYGSNKELFLYFLNKDNFLKERSRPLSKDIFTRKENLEFRFLNFDAKEKIKEEYLNTKIDSPSELIDIMLKLSTKEDINYDSLLDIFLWLYIYDQKKFIFEFLTKDPSRRHKNLLGLINGKDFDLSELVKDFSESQTRDPLCIILIRYYLNNSFEFTESSFELLSKNFFSQYIFQFFFRDLIRFNNLAMAKLTTPLYEEKYFKLIKKVEEFYFLKTKLSKIFFAVLKKIYAKKIKSISLVTFHISDKILKI